MKPVEFHGPESLEEVFELLERYGEEAKLIAGGTALVIMMKQSLVRPAALISLRKLPEFREIRSENGTVSLGALVTHREVETSALVRERVPVLAETYHHVATLRVRNMATVGGGLVHGDPNQDPPCTLIALGARLRVRSRLGTQEFPAEDFFLDYYETAVKPTELLAEVRVPRPSPRSGQAYLKFLPRTADDYATVGAAAALSLSEDGRTCTEVRIALGCVAATPLRAREAEDVLRGREPSAAGIREAAEKAKGITDPVSDHRGSAEYKRDMAAVFVRRALEQALAGARESLGKN
jgi:aerobic carbon-monoxide dehydrogenase medium subunit